MKRYLLTLAAGAMVGGFVTTLVSERIFGTSGWPPAARAQVTRQTPLHATRSSAPTNPRPAAQLTPEELANVRVYEIANPGVVNINTRSLQYDSFFSLPSAAEGSGSGSVIDKQGHILTNFHVVEGAQEVVVTLANGNSYRAELVGGDKTDDLAILRITAPPDELHPIRMGRSNNLRVGQRVYVLGNPFGLEGTLTTGIVSSLNRSLPSRQGAREMRSIIQTDAAMNPGNSGGPMLDTRGFMVGMNVAIASRTGQSAGVGFAIPVDRISRLVPKLIKFGKVTRPEMGISEVLETTAGLRIRRLTRGGAAEVAGLRGPQLVRRQYRLGNQIIERTEFDPKAADLIVAVNGRPVRTAADLLEIIDAHQPGDIVEVSVERDGDRQIIPVELGAT